MENKKLPLIQGTVPKRGKEFYHMINRIYEKERKEVVARSSNKCCSEMYRAHKKIL